MPRLTENHMLSTKPLKSGSAGAIVVYCRHAKRKPRTKTGYYSADGAPSFWTGSLAADAGLAGPVQQADFLAGLLGRIDDADLGTGRGDRRHGYDVTFSAPKSVSMLCLIAGDARVATAHDQAVREALLFVEAEVATGRYGKNGQTVQRGGGIAAAVFCHEDSRAINEQADPQLHSHAIILNATRGLDGLRAVNLDWGPGAVRMKLADAHYKNVLARRLGELGYRIEPTSDGFEIADVPRAAIDCFSRRKEAIDSALIAMETSREASTAGQRMDANLITRQGKSGLDQADQRRQWRQRAGAIGVSLRTLMLDAIRRGPQPQPERTKDAVRSPVRHLAERKTVFERDASRLEALQVGLGGTSLYRVDEAMAEGEAGLIDVGGGLFIYNGGRPDAGSGDSYGDACRLPGRVSDLGRGSRRAVYRATRGRTGL